MNAGALLDESLAALRTRLRRWARVFDARAPRERIVLLVAVSAVTLMLADKLWLTPAFERSRLAGQRLHTAQATLTTLRNDVARLQSLGVEQDRQLREEVAQWKQRADTNAAALRSYENSLVGADRMVELLEQMLPRHGRLHVRELRSLGRTDLLAAPAAAPAPAAAASAGKQAAAAPAGGPSLYRHGVELTLEGSWSDQLDYLKALETMPRHVLWGGMTMKVEQHPKVVLTLRLYTLSLDRGWLEI